MIRRKTIADIQREQSQAAKRKRAMAADRDEYVDEIASMVEVLVEGCDEQGRDELLKREFMAAWRIFCRRHGVPLDSGLPEYAYQHALWRDAVARRMGWARGRRGDGEWVHQRRLEAEGQLRVPGA